MNATGRRVDITATRTGWIVTGEIDAFSSTTLREAFADLPQTGDSAIELDLAGVTFMDSSGIAVLLELADRTPQSRRVMIRTASPQVARVLDITGLTSTFAG